MTPDLEQWRPVVGWEDLYEISDHGRVRGIGGYGRRKQILSAHPGRHGYLRVKLWRWDGAGRSWLSIHSAVLSAFVGPRPEGHLACHNDGNVANNRLDNLRWDTPSGNQLDSVRHGTHWETRKSHCDHGHPFDEANTHWETVARTGRLRRVCRACGRERARRRRYASKGVAA